MKKRGCIWAELIKITDMVETKIKYLRSVLIRIVSTFKTLSSRSLPFRGSFDKFCFPHNGNYIMVLELIAEFVHFYQAISTNLKMSEKGYIT